MGSGSSTEPKDVHVFQAKALCKAAIKGSTGVLDQEDKVLCTFQEWDVDNNGKLSVDELFSVGDALGFFTKGESQDVKRKQLGGLLDEMDFDKDGYVSFEEFVHYVFRAPFLEDYVKYSKKVCPEHIKARMGVNGEKLTKLLENQRKKLEKDFLPIIQNIYAWHDKDGSGKLDTGESIVFFSNFCAIIPDLQKHIVHETASLAVAIDAIKNYTAWMKNNEENKDELDDRVRAAFDIVDVSKDGMLGETEITQLLLHGSDINLAVMKALKVPVVAC